MTYFYKLTITLTISLSILFSFVFSIDPYDKLSINPLSLKFKGVFDHRTNKYMYINKSTTNFDAFILGSSRAMQLQPKIVKEKTGLNTFNYSVFTAMPEDYLAIAKQVIQKQSPKLIWLQLDFYSLNANMPNTQAFYNSPLYPLIHSDMKQNNKFNIPTEYFSVHALKDAFKVLKKNIKNETPKNYNPTGEAFNTTSKLNSVPILNEYWQHEYSNYKISQQRLKYLKELVRICKKNHIKLLISLSPMHQKHFNKIHDNKELFSKYLKVKEELSEIFPSYIDFNTNKTRTFTTSEYWIDSVHMTTKLGDLITADMFSEKRQFGEVFEYSSSK